MSSSTVGLDDLFLIVFQYQWSLMAQRKKIQGSGYTVLVRYDLSLLVSLTMRNIIYWLSNVMDFWHAISVFKNLYLSNLVTSRSDRLGFSNFSISRDGPITLESYIFGYDIIYNSSINSTSHLVSVTCTFLTLPPSPTRLFFSWNHSSFTSHESCVCHVISSHHISSPFLVRHCCGSRMIYRAIQCGARSVDCLSEEGDLSRGGVRLFDAFAF